MANTKKKDPFDKIFTGIGCFLFVILVFILGLFGWAVIELVNWITTK